MSDLPTLFPLSPYTVAVEEETAADWEDVLSAPLGNIELLMANKHILSELFSRLIKHNNARDLNNLRIAIIRIEGADTLFWSLVNPVAAEEGKEVQIREIAGYREIQISVIRETL